MFALLFAHPFATRLQMLQTSYGRSRGVLDPRAFERARVDLGRCDVCNTGKAVYHSPEAQTHICEGCYARLVREGNAREGIR